MPTFRLENLTRRQLQAGAAALLVGLLLAGFLLRPRHATATTDSSPLPVVTVTKPHRGALDSTVSFTGMISARDDLPIGVDGEGGRIIGVYAQAGDHVRAGQVLARLDPSIVGAQVESLNASLEEAEAAAGLAQAEFKRVEAIAHLGALSKEEFERRRAGATTAAAKVKVADALLREGRGRLARLDVVAPTAGLILARRAEIGQSAAQGGEPLFHLAKDSEIELRGQVAELDLPQLAVGQTVAVSITGIGHSFPGTVWLIGTTIDPQTNLGSVRVLLHPSPSLRPGGYARALVTVDHAVRIVVPQSAVLSDPTGSYVLILDKANTVSRRAVSVQASAPGGLVIGSGLQGDEDLIAIAGAFLREGETVRRAPHTAAKL